MQFIIIIIAIAMTVIFINAYSLLYAQYLFFNKDACTWVVYTHNVYCVEDVE